MTDDAPVLHAGIGGVTLCKSCKAMIVFATTSSGKLMPFERDPNGLWTVEYGVARYLGKGDAQLELGKAPMVRFTSHFATCKDAAQWRKPK